MKIELSILNEKNDRTLIAHPPGALSGDVWHASTPLEQGNEKDKLFWILRSISTIQKPEDENLELIINDKEVAHIFAGALVEIVDILGTSPVLVFEGEQASDLPGLRRPV